MSLAPAFLKCKPRTIKGRTSSKTKVEAPRNRAKRICKGRRWTTSRLTSLVIDITIYLISRAQRKRLRERVKVQSWTTFLRQKVRRIWRTTTSRSSRAAATQTIISYWWVDTMTLPKTILTSTQIFIQVTTLPLSRGLESQTQGRERWIIQRLLRNIATITLLNPKRRCKTISRSPLLKRRYKMTKDIAQAVLWSTLAQKERWRWVSNYANLPSHQTTETNRLQTLLSSWNKTSSCHLVLLTMLCKTMTMPINKRTRLTNCSKCRKVNKAKWLKNRKDLTVHLLNTIMSHGNLKKRTTTSSKTRMMRHLSLLSSRTRKLWWSL